MPITGQDLIDGASDLADMVGDPHVATATWLRWANRAQDKLCRKLATLYQGWYVTTADFTLTGGANGDTFALPAAAQQVLGITKDPDNPALRYTLHRRNFEERDEQYLRTYAVIGQTIDIQPFEYAAGSFRVYYVARPTALTVVGSTLDTQLEPWVEYIETYMAIQAHGKEESDNTDLKETLKEIWEEIEAESMNRNAAAGETIIDVDRTGGGWNYLVRP